MEVIAYYALSGSVVAAASGAIVLCALVLKIRNVSPAITQGGHAVAGGLFTTAALLAAIGIAAGPPRPVVPWPWAGPPSLEAQERLRGVGERIATAESLARQLRTFIDQLRHRVDRFWRTGDEWTSTASRSQPPSPARPDLQQAGRLDGSARSQPGSGGASGPTDEAFADAAIAPSDDELSGRTSAEPTPGRDSRVTGVAGQPDANSQQPRPTEVALAARPSPRPATGTSPTTGAEAPHVPLQPCRPRAKRPCGPTDSSGQSDRPRSERTEAAEDVAIERAAQPLDAPVAASISTAPSATGSDTITRPRLTPAPSAPSATAPAPVAPTPSMPPMTVTTPSGHIVVLPPVTLTAPPFASGPAVTPTTPSVPAAPSIPPVSVPPATAPSVPRGTAPPVPSATPPGPLATRPPAPITPPPMVSVPRPPVPVVTPPAVPQVPSVPRMPVQR